MNMNRFPTERWVVNYGISARWWISNIFLRTFSSKLWYLHSDDVYQSFFTVQRDSNVEFLFSSFLAATKQLYEWFSPSVRPSVRLSFCLSVRPSHLFDYVPIIVSSWNFQELLPVTEVASMLKVKVRGQRSRSQRSQPNLTVSGL